MDEIRATGHAVEAVVTSSVGHDGGFGQNIPGHIRGPVEFHGDLFHPFAGVITAICIRIMEDQVADAHRHLKTEVDGEIHGGVHKIIAGGIDAGFAVCRGRRRTCLNEDDVGGDSIDGGFGVIEPILAHIIITKEPLCDADQAIQGRSGLEHAGRHMDDVSARHQTAEQVTPAISRGGYEDRCIGSGRGQQVINFHFHSIHTLTG